jgi:hypothetical protein
MYKANIVIPTIGKNEMIVRLLSQILDINDDIIKNIYIYDNGMTEEVRNKCINFGIEVIDAHGQGIYSMWNSGVLKSLIDKDIGYICIFNDDLILDVRHNWFKDLLSPLDNEDVWATCGNYNYIIHNEDLEYKPVIGTYKNNGFAGFCFAVARKAYSNGLPLFDENYNWWYGDDDFVNTVYKNNKQAVLSIKANMIHIDGGSKSVVQYTPDFNRMVEQDRILYYRKWYNE